MLSEQSRHVAYIVKTCLDRQVRVMETSQAAEDEWVDTIRSTAILRQKFAEECTPGYYNNEGQPSPLAIQNGSYGKGSIAFMQLLEEWRADGELKGLELE
jgi:cyclohexanone monooxygenase